ncbi:MAG: hypothetical protein P8J64_04630 [Dehalococcoidia bacterium]|jgi:hypothetical protein|nr:hypothetical protein [Dehalococcoidia bacterium]
MIFVFLSLLGLHLIGLLVLTGKIRQVSDPESRQRLSKFLLLYSSLGAPVAIGILLSA